MKFIKSSFDSVYLIELESIEDDRGFFARSFCQKEFMEYNLNPQIVQCNISYNKKDVLRGMHFQIKPYEETKLVRCIRGKIYDVVIDLRPESSTYCLWEGFELSAKNRKILYVPKGFAHGFQSLEDDTEVFYQLSEFYYPEYASGVRWDDAVFGIKWPITNPILSKKDQNCPDYHKVNRYE